VTSGWGTAVVCATTTKWPNNGTTSQVISLRRAQTSPPPSNVHPPRRRLRSPDEFVGRRQHAASRSQRTTKSPHSSRDRAPTALEPISVGLLSASRRSTAHRGVGLPLRSSLRFVSPPCVACVSARIFGPTYRDRLFIHRRRHQGPSPPQGVA
jgi:hypothetical protein